MSNISSLYKSLPSNEHSFTIDEVGEVSRVRFQGNFTCKIGNLKTQAAVAKHRAMLNGGFEEGLDIGTKNLHHMISYLRYTLTEMPKWWIDEDNGYELLDVNIVEKIYFTVLDFEKSWIETIWGPKEDKKEEKSE